MDVIEVTLKDYGACFPTTAHVYDSVPFIELNRHKCEHLACLLFHDGTIRGGMVAGLRDGVLHAPFSAPFGGIEWTRRQSVRCVDAVVEALGRYAAEKHLPVSIIFPPMVYSVGMPAAIAGALSRNASCTVSHDLSYHINLPEYGGQSLTAKGRSRLSNSFKASLDLCRLSGNEADIRRVYALVKANHDAKGYPVKMSVEEVIATSRIVPADYFVLQSGGLDLAGAQVFHSAPGIVQLIYWGDIPGHGLSGVMNRFAHELAVHYRSQGLRILDFGPASLDGVPDYGLCEFKTNVGCEVSLKPRALFRP
mgnify:CR=1 FL=1